MAKMIFVLALVAALGLSACGDDKPPTTTNRTDTHTTAAGVATKPTQTETAQATTPVPPTNFEFFQSPSGNIGCAATADGAAQVRCDIREHSFKTPAKPADCELDYGGGLVIEAGSDPRFVCAGDTTLNDGPILKYGQVNEVGLISCTSRQAGVTCVDTETGRGFFLSRDSYKLL